MSQYHSKQRVIMITKSDPYKPHEPSQENPRWIVPTSKKVRKSTQPRQSKGSKARTAQQAAYHSTEGDMQELPERVSQTQAYFYRTTRSQGKGNANRSVIEGDSSQPLAIDHRNTINLQKAIDQYYDGDLTLDQLHNGDLHSMQMAQKKNSSTNVSRGRSQDDKNVTKHEVDT